MNQEALIEAELVRVDAFKHLLCLCISEALRYVEPYFLEVNECDDPVRLNNRLCLLSFLGSKPYKLEDIRNIEILAQIVH